MKEWCGYPARWQRLLCLRRRLSRRQRKSKWFYRIGAHDIVNARRLLESLCASFTQLDVVLSNWSTAVRVPGAAKRVVLTLSLAFMKTAVKEG